jgi:hypothetical protein
LSSAPPDVQRAQVNYPGGLTARYRWSGSGRAANVYDLSEATGAVSDFGPLVDPEPDRLCRAEMRVEGPAGAWTARFASVIFDQPQGVLWDSAGLLLVKYGFALYALDARGGDLRWHHSSGTPTVVILASPMLEHALLQTELETLALRADGDVSWRAAHNDVVTGAELIAGQLVLRSYAGGQLVLDARTGRSLS